MKPALTAPVQVTSGDVPPLASGDRLTRSEFERRYHLMPHIKKAELIEGVVYMPSPVRMTKHSVPHGTVVALLGFYAMSTEGVESATDGTVRLDLDNEPQPDAFLRIHEACGGQSKLAADDYIEGAPELVFEIAASSAAIDLNDKLVAYRRNGVREYFIWRTFDRVIDALSLRDGEYIATPEEAGVARSAVFPGLWLDLDALVEGNSPRALATLQRGLATPEHAAFVERLRTADTRAK